MADDGSNMHPRLRAEIEAIRAIPFDDGINEGPHARAKRLQVHSRGSKFPWQASSMRLAQNLADARESLDSVEGDFAPLWYAWKSVVKVGGNMAMPKVSDKRFLEMLYRMSFCTELVGGLRDPRGLPRGSGGGPGPGPGPGGGDDDLRRGGGRGGEDRDDDDADGGAGMFGRV